MLDIAYLTRSGAPAPSGPAPPAPAAITQLAPHFRLDAAPDSRRRTPLPAP